MFGSAEPLGCARGREGRDRRLRERAARGRALAGVRAARAAGGRSGRGDAARSAASRARGRCSSMPPTSAPTWCSSITGSSGATSRSSSTGASAGASRRSSARTPRSSPTTSPSTRTRRSATPPSSRRGSAPTPEGPFGSVGLACSLDGISVDELTARVLGRPRARAARVRRTAPTRIERLAVSTGAAGYDLIRAAHEGFDALLTGEPEEPNLRDRAGARHPPDRGGPPRDRAVRRPGARRASRRHVRDRVALPRGRQPGLASRARLLRRAKNGRGRLRTSCAGSILIHHGAFREAGPLTPVSRQPSVDSARLRTLRRRAFLMLKGGDAWRIT